MCRDGKGGIPVKSRCKCGNPDRDCTENNRFCSAKSTKSEIGAKVGQMPLVTSSAAAAESEMKAGGTLYSIFFKLFNDYFKDNVTGLGGMDCESYPRETVSPSFEPQPTGLMLKKRFLGRSGRKYEKSWSFGHGVG